jgi:hypothetical protein
MIHPYYMPQLSVPGGERTSRYAEGQQAANINCSISIIKPQPCDHFFLRALCDKKFIPAASYILSVTAILVIPRVPQG